MATLDTQQNPLLCHVQAVNLEHHAVESVTVNRKIFQANNQKEMV